MSVSFQANGGQGTVMILSDPNQPAASSGYGHIIADDLQNFTAVQTVDVLLADSPDGASGIFDVLVDGKVLPKMVQMIHVEYVTRDQNANSVEQGFTFNSVPQPEIAATITNPAISDDGTNVKFDISGSVTDPASDYVEPDYQLQSLVISCNGAPDIDINLLNSGVPDLHWHPYKFLANFRATVNIPIQGAGEYGIAINSSLNVAGVPLSLEIPVKVSGSQALGYSTSVGSGGVILTKNAWTDFLPTLLRVKNPNHVLAEPVIITAFGQNWNTQELDFGDGRRFYAVDTNGKPVVFLPALNTKSYIQTTKITDKTFDVKVNGKLLGQIPVVQGLVVYNGSVKNDVNAALNNCDEASYPLGSAKCFAYTASTTKPFSNKGTDVKSEIIFRFVGTSRVVHFFESTQEFQNDIAYRLNVVTNAPLLNNLAWGGGNLKLNPNLWVFPTANIPFREQPFKCVGDSAEASLNDIWANPNKYALACEDAAKMITYHAAANIFHGTFDGLVKPNNNSVSASESLFLKTGTSADLTQDEHYWIPGDWGVIINNQDNIPNVNLNGEENVIYLGAGNGNGCFDQDQKFEVNSVFFGQIPANLGSKSKSLKDWKASVAGLGGTPKPPEKQADGTLKTSPIVKIGVERFRLKQPLGP